MSVDERQRVGAAGYGCLLILTLAGGLGGVAAVFWGVARFLRAREERLASGEDAAALLSGLEGAVAWVGLGVLALLVGGVALVVLLKELSDDAQQRGRGPVR